MPRVLSDIIAYLFSFSCILDGYRNSSAAVYFQERYVNSYGWVWYVIILAIFIGLHIIYLLVLQKMIWCTYDIEKIHVFYKV